MFALFFVLVSVAKQKFKRNFFLVAKYFMYISSVLLVCIVNDPAAIERYPGLSSEAQEPHSSEGSRYPNGRAP